MFNVLNICPLALPSAWHWRYDYSRISLFQNSASGKPETPFPSPVNLLYGTTRTWLETTNVFVICPLVLPPGNSQDPVAPCIEKMPLTPVTVVVLTDEMYELLS